MLASMAVRWSNLRKKLLAEKRVAFVLSNYPTRNARIGNAVGLDTPASLLNILRAMKMPATALASSGIRRCAYPRAD